MKKAIVLSLSLIVCLGLSACGKKEVREDAGAPAGGLTVLDNDSLSGWLKKGGAVECTLSAPEGEIVIMSKNEAVRMEGIPFFSPDSSGEMPRAENGVMLTAGDWTYMWDKESLKGTKMDNRQFEDSEESGNLSDSEKKDWDDMVGEWEAGGFGYDCREINLSDELFSEPTGVDFIDLSAMFTGIQAEFEAMLDAPPAPDFPDFEALNIPSDMNQEDIEAMIEGMSGEELPFE